MSYGTEASTVRKQTNILVLTGSLGHGHIQTANAIRDIVAQRFGEDVNVHVVDYLEQMAPHLHGVGSYCFVQWLKHFPSMYGYMFEMTRKDRGVAQFVKNVRLTSLRPLSKLIRELTPDVIVSTFPAASAAVSKLKERGITHCPAVTVITDHTDHSFWLHPYTDLYMVGSEAARTKLIRQGINPSYIEVTGIPVRPEFYEQYDKQALRANYLLQPDKMTVLLMGGGCGLMDLSILEALEHEQWAKHLQFIIVCGNNDKLRRQLQQWASSSPLHLRIEGYVKPVHEYMAMSDLIITKSGGVTTAEAIAQQLPLLVYKPLPGQERDNIRYLVRNGLACRAKGSDDLVRQLAYLAANPEKLQRMGDRALTERGRMQADSAEAILRMAQQTAVRPQPTAKRWMRRNAI